MKKYPVDKLRNVALIAHGGAGKTSLAEAMLFITGATDRLGRPDDGNTVLDWEPEETKRQISISLGVAPCEWNDHKLNLVDTPGYFDFVGEVQAALRVVEGAILVVDAVAGVQVGTELTWRYANDQGKAMAVVINKMDRENASFTKTLSALEEAFGRTIIPVQVPIGEQADFKGVVDLVREKAFISADKGVQEGDVPADLQDQVQSLREQMIEAAAEADDELTLKYLEGEALSSEEIAAGLKAGVAAGKIVPVFCTASSRPTGIQALLDGLVAYMPSPAEVGAATGEAGGAAAQREPKADEPFSALVFKTTADPFVGRLTLFRVFSGLLSSDSQIYNATKGKTERIGQIFLPKGKQQVQVAQVGPGDIAAVAKLQVTVTGDTLADESKPIVLPGVQFPAPVYGVAVHPKAKGDEEKIGTSLSRLAEEDPTLKVERNTITNETVVSAMGDMHMEVMIDRLKRKFGVDAEMSTPKIPYKETIRKPAKAEYKHKKQSGGRGQYGHVHIEIQPLPDEDYAFVDKIFGGVVPQQYRPAVDKGCRETMVDGILAGYPVTNVQVTLTDGSYHDVDSSEMAFKLAASQAFKKAFMDAGPVLLEPIVEAEVRIPDAYMGDVIGDLNKKRGRILGMEPVDGLQIVKAQVPQVEMAKYAIDLRSITQGRGTFSIRFAHYEEMPANIAEPIIAAHKSEE